MMMAQKCTLEHIWTKVYLFDLLTFFLRTSLHGKNPADTYFTLQRLTEVHIIPVLVFKFTPCLFYAGFPVSTTRSLSLREKLALLPRAGMRANGVGGVGLCPTG